MNTAETVKLLQAHLKSAGTVTTGGYSFRINAPRIFCPDGFNVSVQASKTHYCEPREDNPLEWMEVELGFPSERIPEWMEYAENADDPTESVYGYVPINIVAEVLSKRGWTGE